VIQLTKTLGIAGRAIGPVVRAEQSRVLRGHDSVYPTLLVPLSTSILGGTLCVPCRHLFSAIATCFCYLFYAHAYKVRLAQCDRAVGNQHVRRAATLPNGRPHGLRRCHNQRLLNRALPSSTPAGEYALVGRSGFVRTRHLGSTVTHGQQTGDLVTGSAAAQPAPS